MIKINTNSTQSILSSCVSGTSGRITERTVCVKWLVLRRPLWNQTTQLQTRSATTCTPQIQTLYERINSYFENLSTKVSTGSTRRYISTPRKSACYPVPARILSSASKHLHAFFSVRHFLKYYAFLPALLSDCFSLSLTNYLHRSSCLPLPTSANFPDKVGLPPACS
jgi:hypothetical protein